MEASIRMARINIDNSVQGAVYRALKEAILELQLAPGTVMSTQEMATRLNVSRTPVREAFIRLQREGLVDIVPQRETMVSRIDLDRVEQERFIRESLELPVVDLFLAKCRPEHFTELRELIEQQKNCHKEHRWADFVHCDNQLHKLLFDVAGQRLAWDTIMSVNGHYNRIRILTVQNEDTIVGAIRQHIKIVDLLEHGEHETARRELTDHVKKINYEKTDLIKLHPDYFKTGDEPVGIRIGSL